MWPGNVFIIGLIITYQQLFYYVVYTHTGIKRRVHMGMIHVVGKESI